MLLPETFFKFLDALGPFESRPEIAVAVSGGADSMALCLLAQEWALARGGKVIAITTEGGGAIHSLADHVVEVPAAHPLLAPILTVVPLQLFAYYVADFKGTDVDQPRNLAKSVTVE